MSDKSQQVIDYLTGPIGLKVHDLVEKLGIERSAFYSWRRSVNDHRRNDLANKLMDLYAEHFPDGKIPGGTPSNDANSIREKYIQMLEENLKELREERDRLRDENLQLLKEVKNKLNMISEHLIT